MPIYEYKCERCNHQLEMLQKISDDPATICPECSENGLKKLVSAATFKLKGTGWYKTDFKDRKPAKDSKTSGTDSKASRDKPADSKSESKTSKSDSSKSTTKKAAGSD